MTVERVERALLLMAYILTLDGPKYAPLYERLERELQAMKRDDVMERARARIQSYAGSTLKAIA